MNHDWVWGPDNPRLEKAARLSVQIHGASPAPLGELLQRWLDTLTRDAGGGWFRGGWAVDVVSHQGGSAELVLSSGGQDVADSLQDAADSFHEQVLEPLELDPLMPGTVTWTELPLR